MTFVGETVISSVPSELNCLGMEPFEDYSADTVPLKAHQTRLVHCLLSNRETRNTQICSTRHRGPRTLPKTTDANVDCALV